MDGKFGDAEEGVHPLVNTVNQGLMLYGICREATPPNEQHPLGHGRELYFWCFVVAMLIFSLGAGIAIYEGVMHTLHPAIIANPKINYIVLGLSFVFEAATWWIALRDRRGRSLPPSRQAPCRAFVKMGWLRQ